MSFETLAEAAQLGEIRLVSDSGVSPWIREPLLRGMALTSAQRFSHMSSLLVELATGEPVSITSTNRVQVEIVLAADYDQFGEDDLRYVVDLLHVATRDRHLSIKSVTRGSVILVLETTKLATVRLLQLHVDGQLGQSLGVPIERFDIRVSGPGSVMLAIAGLDRAASTEDRVRGSQRQLDSFASWDDPTEFIDLRTPAIRRFFSSKVGPTTSMPRSGPHSSASLPRFGPLAAGLNWFSSPPPGMSSLVSCESAPKHRVGFSTPSPRPGIWSRARHGPPKTKLRRACYGPSAACPSTPKSRWNSTTSKVSIFRLSPKSWSGHARASPARYGEERGFSRRLSKHSANTRIL